MATRKLLEKKIIVVANIGGLAETKFKLKVGSIVTAVKNNPTYVPNIVPSPEEVELELKNLDDLFINRGILSNLQKTNTINIEKSIYRLENIINSRWVNQVQNAPGITIARIIRLGLGIKGHINGKTKDVVGKASNSNPIITSVESKHHLQHTIHIFNSANGKTAKPADAKSLEIYMQIGGEMPTDTSKMHREGSAINGKYKETFKAEDLYKLVYYAAVYISKETLKPMIFSPVFIAVIQ
jgi:hypothetical protein